MQGVASLLEEKYYQLVKELWAELTREFAVSGVYATPYPHFSYQVAKRYDIALLEPVLQQFAANKKSFQVRTAGLGIFTGPHPVLYIPVVHSPELTQFHEALWQEISSTGSGIEEYYHPSHWMPHITIGIGDMNKDNLSCIVRLLAEREFNWEITVDNIALIYDSISTPFGTTMLGDQFWYPAVLKRLQIHRLDSA
jgi:2'-5' RNA ligase